MVECVRVTNCVIRMLLFASFWCMGVERRVMKFFLQQYLGWVMTVSYQTCPPSPECTEMEPSCGPSLGHNVHWDSFSSDSWKAPYNS